MSVLQRTKICVPSVRYYSRLSSHIQFRSLINKYLPFAYISNFLLTKVGQNYSYQKCFEFSQRWKSGKSDISSLVVPVPIKPGSNPDDINVGEELAGKIKKGDLLKILNHFYKQPEVKELAEENGIDSRLFHQAAVSFRRFCMESDTLPVDLHIVFSDILRSAGHIDDIFPYFLQHCRQIYPHLECIDDLKKISDLRVPANWYPEARALNRKLIFHAGPTNSGKTYHALERFTLAKSGVYCGPLKLLATEVFNKTNERETPCDLITGEERQCVLPDITPANHVSCTVEMASVINRYEVAVIDEIQMIRDPGRGWAWTRALLGLAADEIHICGEEAAINLVKEIAASVGEEVEVRRYKRLTKLTVENSALESLDNVRPGDCIVCFSKNDIFAVSLKLERKGYECAVIYGGLPPGTKLSQAKKFNDPDDPCKILVSTDAIGMGLNLSIRRVIFYSLVKPVMNEKGEKEMDTISTSQALQIGGRAGRFNTQFSEGFVTTFRNDDLPLLRNIMGRSVETIEIAGLHPTAEQIELFAYHLPHATLSNLIDIFVSLSQLDTASYFMCNIEDFKFLADMIQHVPLPLRARYVFCCAPINRKLPFVCTMFLKFARQYGRNDPLTFDWLCRTIGWPFLSPKSLVDLVHLESVFDVLDLYLWFSYRFADLFPDVQLVRDMQRELDEVIQHGVLNITNLVRAGEAGSSYATVPDEDDFAQKDQRRFNYKGTEEEEYEENFSRNRSKSSGLFQSKKLSFSGSSGEAEYESSQCKKANIGQGSLTNHLLSRGLITPRMLEELKKEWKHSLFINEDPTESESQEKSQNRSSRINSRRRTKKK